MKEFLTEINNWLAENRNFAVATVIQTWGSAPRPVGSSMFIDSDMNMMGSVSGGCVEGAVVRTALDVLSTQRPQLLSFGISDEEAWEVGLSCGGAIKVFVEPYVSLDNPEISDVLRGGLKNNKGCILMIKMTGGSSEHVLVLPNGEAISKNKNRQSQHA